VIARSAEKAQTFSFLGVVEVRCNCGYGADRAPDADKDKRMRWRIFGPEAARMRRLAKQSRKDTYKSNRDYQTLFDHVGQRIRALGGASNTLIFVAAKGIAILNGLVSWGAYLAAEAPCRVFITFRFGNGTSETELALDSKWRRAGGLAISDGQEPVELQLRSEKATSLDVWGIAIGAPTLPVQGEGASKLGIEELHQSHLIPETFFLRHDSAMLVDIDEERSSKIHMQNGRPIQLKKCSYCGRLLPVDPERLGALAFHKHNAKLTHHQNECRACKKWRINDSFNPLRTTDQLHESSVITRERKILLREPEILQSIKDRTGAGLKSLVWERFDRRCFRCGKRVALSKFQLDHTRPLAYLWPIDEHATCLCSECNNEKKEKFPIDFYSRDQLIALSKLTGLSLVELEKKDINMRELARIMEDLPLFAREWEPRTFLATARKVKELRPNIDLLDELRRRDPSLHASLQQELRERPPAVDDE
jgi:hypothetical protein